MTRIDGRAVDVPLEHTDVHIRVDGIVAETMVTQRFGNPYTQKIEAIYLFPLPTTAAIGALTIKTGDRTIRGRIEERGKAKAVYEAARRDGLVAALLTQERPNLFTQHVANLEPGTSIEVALSYVQRLDYEDGGYALAFPMVAGPRFVPSTAKPSKDADPVNPTTLPAGLRPAHDISLRVDLDAGVAIENITSSSHQLRIDRPGEKSRATVTIAPTDTIPNKDFTLRYQVAGDAPKFAVLGHRADAASTGSFLFVAQPPATPKPKQIAAREIVFVLDTSSSMRGAPFAKAKELIRRVLWTLRPDDTFQIVRFADRSSALGPGPISAKPKNVELTLAWLARLEAGGGTEMIDGISAALAIPHDPLRLRILAFVTDGYVGNEDDILANVGKRIGASRLFTFGVGSAVNRYLLEEMASFGRGAVQVVRPDEDTGRAVTAFEQRIGTPVLTDLRVDWGALAGKVRDVTPGAIPDLFAGQPLVLSGHYTGGGTGTVKVHARQAGVPVTFDVPVALPETTGARGEAIASIWARARIAELGRKLLRGADPAARKEVLSLGLAHHLLTPYTAFVAVDESRVTAGHGARRVVVPVHVPEYVRRGHASHDGDDGYGYGATGGAIGNGSYGSAHVYAKPSLVLPAPARVEGSLDAATIRTYMQRKTAQIRYCYERALPRNPTLAGTVTSTFAIAPSGAVISASAGGLGDKEVEACVAQVLRGLEFPKTSGSTIKVNYPFVFKPAAKAPVKEINP